MINDSFPNIFQLFVIACTLPVTSAEAERSFFEKSTMAEDHMGDLGIIAMHYGVRIPVEDVCQAFARENPSCLFKSSLFFGIT